MRQLRLTQVTHSATGMSLVTDATGAIAYYITGEMGQKGNTLRILNQSATVLAELELASLGFLPRFTMTVNGHQVGSIGLSLQLHEISFVSGLNWLILGNLDKQKFQITHLHYQLAITQPNNDGRLAITIYDEPNEAQLVLIAAFLDRWQFIASGRTAPWLSFFATPQRLLGSSYELHPELPGQSQSDRLESSIKSH